jgi:hypothetical protein
MVPESAYVYDLIGIQGTECLMDSHRYRQISGCIDTQIDDSLNDIGKGGTGADKSLIHQLQHSRADKDISSNFRPKLMNIHIFSVTCINEIHQGLRQSRKSTDIQ